MRNLSCQNEVVGISHFYSFEYFLELEMGKIV